MFRSQLERLLHEFPWLWAIRPEWSSAQSVNVQLLPYHILPFARHAHVGISNYWAVYVNRDSTYIMRVLGPKEMLVEQALDLCRPGYRIKYLVVNQDFNSEHYTIYRARAKGFLHEEFEVQRDRFEAERV
jgi:hypothetical protein